LFQNIFKEFVFTIINKDVNCLFVGEWAGFGCGWTKLNVLQFGLACAVALQLF
jgi:hypothetical protein